MEAVATYTIQDTGSALEAILKVGAGVLVVALAAATLIFMLRKKNNKKTDEESEV